MKEEFICYLNPEQSHAENFGIYRLIESNQLCLMVLCLIPFTLLQQRRLGRHLLYFFCIALTFAAGILAPMINTNKDAAW